MYRVISTLLTAADDQAAATGSVLSAMPGGTELAVMLMLALLVLLFGIDASIPIEYASAAASLLLEG